VRPPRTLAAYAERFLQSARGRLKYRSWEAYQSNLQNHIVPAFGPQTPLQNITRAAVRDFVQERLAAGYKVGAVLTIFKCLRTLLSTAVDEEIIDANPALRLTRLFPRRDPNPRGKAMSREHVAHFLAVARRRHPQIAGLLFVLARCGLRLGEGLALRWEDVDLAERVLHIRHSLDYRHHLDSPKSGRGRAVDLSRAAAACLAELQEAADLSVPWVFPSPRGRPWCRSYINRVIAAVLEEAGLPRHYRAHALRHTFASLLADHGVSAWTIRDLLGHRDLVTTQLYVELRERHLEAVDRLDALA